MKVQATDVVVAVPVYKAALTDDEELSARHLAAFLGGFDVVLFAPEGLAVPLPGYPVERFEAGYFDSVEGYSRLLLSEGFYRRFASYRHLLIYQLDCLVFSDALLPFCALGYDYLGAPWLRDRERPERGFSRVGNGGLSLRRTEAFLRVLGGPRRSAATLRGLSAPLPDLEQLPVTERLAKRLQVLREARVGAREYARHYSLNEDRFWSDRAALFDPSFRVAPVAEGLRFSFELAPAHGFEAAGGRRPFGCHAWAKHDRSFWEPHLLQENSPCATLP